MSAPQYQPAGVAPTPAPSPELTPLGPPRHPLRRTTVVAAVLALVMLFGLVAFQALIVRNQSKLDDLDAQLAEGTRVNQRLRLEVAELEAPERIRAVALLQLGMVEPDTVTYLEPISSSDLDPASSEGEHP